MPLRPRHPIGTILPAVRSLFSPKRYDQYLFIHRHTHGFAYPRDPWWDTPITLFVEACHRGDLAEVQAIFGHRYICYIEIARSLTVAYEKRHFSIIYFLAAHYPVTREDFISLFTKLPRYQKTSDLLWQHLLLKAINANDMFFVQFLYSHFYILSPTLNRALSWSIHQKKFDLVAFFEHRGANFDYSVFSGNYMYSFRNRRPYHTIAYFLLHGVPPPTDYHQYPTDCSIEALISPEFCQILCDAQIDFTQIVLNQFTLSMLSYCLVTNQHLVTLLPTLTKQILPNKAASNSHTVDLLYFQLQMLIEPYLFKPDYKPIQPLLQELLTKITLYQQIAVSADKNFHILL